MIVETKQLTGAALDWAVAQCEGIELYGAADFKEQRLHVADIGGNYLYRWSQNWAQGGPIIEREQLTVQCDETGEWAAYVREFMFGGSPDGWSIGPTPLVAAMRCFVRTHKGDTVDVPQEVL